MAAHLFRLALLLALLALFLGGCATTRTTATTTEALCAPWRAITYSGKSDSPQTARQIRVHNDVGKRLKCWR